MMIPRCKIETENFIFEISNIVVNKQWKEQQMNPKDEKKTFDLHMVDAIKVQFLKPIFEDDFPEKGMKAWLTDIEYHDNNQCYKLHFDFTDFEAENEKYFKAEYYDNNGTPCLTAKEIGMYTPKYSVYFGDLDWDASKMNEELEKCLKIL
jgi:hypothetical protein